jgi:hypothetical protein
MPEFQAVIGMQADQGEQFTTRSLDALALNQVITFRA